MAYKSNAILYYKIKSMADKDPTGVLYLYFEEK